MGCSGYCSSSCEYYNDPVEYYVCDECGESDVTLYWDGDKQYCADCLVKKHWDEFIECYEEDIISNFASDYAEGYESVNQDE